MAGGAPANQCDPGQGCQQGEAQRRQRQHRLEARRQALHGGLRGCRHTDLHCAIEDPDDQRAQREKEYGEPVDRGSAGTL
jgi:hypothetical protein